MNGRHYTPGTCLLSDLRLYAIIKQRRNLLLLPLLSRKFAQFDPNMVVAELASEPTEPPPPVPSSLSKRKEVEARLVEINKEFSAASGAGDRAKIMIFND